METVLKILAFFLAFIAIAILSVRMVKKARQIDALKESSLALDQTIISVSRENEKLKEEISQVGSDEYKEKIAREKYGYAYPDDRIYYKE